MPPPPAAVMRRDWVYVRPPWISRIGNIAAQRWDPGRMGSGLASVPRACCRVRAAGCCQRPARPGASKPPGMSRPARLSSIASASFADGGEFEYRMAVRLGDEIPDRGVLARLEVGPRGRGDP